MSDTKESSFMKQLSDKMLLANGLNPLSRNHSYQQVDLEEGDKASRKSTKMSDTKESSFMKQLSAKMLFANVLNPLSRNHSYQQVDLEEGDKQRKRWGHELDAGYPQLVRIGGSLAFFSTILMITLSFFWYQGRMYQTIVYNDAIVNSFDGWGTSLAWWAEFIGSLDEDKRKIFLSKVFHPSNEDSLQLNIIRFNMGGAPKILSNGTTPGIDFSPFKGIPSMQLSNKTYDWNADIFQLTVALEALDLNNDSLIIEAFSNSPPYWMTKSQNSMGNFDGSDNLDAANYSMFADYITTVLDYAINDLNIPIQYVEPFNEPEYYWRVKPQFQEGNHWDQNSMKRFLPILHESLKLKNLDKVVRLSIPDSWSVNNGLPYLDEFDAFDYKANVHGYNNLETEFHLSTMDKYIQRLKQKINIKKIWMSESGGYGLGDLGVTNMAVDIINHLNILEAEAWIYWQVLDQSPAWAMLLISDRYPWWLSADNFYPSPTILFYTMQQFSTHIKSGYRILKTSQSSYKSDCQPLCVLAASSPEKKIVLVLVNTSPKSFYHDISMPQDLITLTNHTIIECYRTAEWNGEAHKKIDHPVRFFSNSISTLLYGFSVTTIELYVKK